MNKEYLTHHISARYNDELQEIINKMLEMGGIVEKQINDGLNALVNSDTELARQVIENEATVNAMEISLDEDCTRLLALRQPTAGDLRLIVAVIKTVTDLERIGDSAKNMARRTFRLHEMEGSSNHHLLLRHLGDMVREMLHDALDAFARTDEGMARKVTEKDAAINNEYENVVGQFVTFMSEDPGCIRSVLEAMWTARALERTGDHVNNLCEYLIYFIKGKDVRHAVQEDPAA